METDAVRTFLDRCRDARASELQEISGELDRLRAKVDAATQEHNKLAPDFNVFSVLNVEEDECIHSNFLANLLEPTGKHGQGTLFLASFLRMCGLTQDITPWVDEIWVRREAAVFEGRFDILIHAAGRLCVLVENKINAAESDKQLAVYEKWLRRRRELQCDKRLVFLTPTGTLSKTIRSDKYLPLSYDENIRLWLTSCREKIAPLHVQCVVDQYLSTISAFCRRRENGRTED